MQEKLTPPITWCGGKRRLLKDIIPLIPEFKGIYYEPFIGAGAVFLELRPKNAIISDINPDIINMWKQIKKYPNKLTKELSSYKVNKKTWYKMNDEFPNLNKKSVKRASYFMFLLSYVFMSIYKLNNNGKFKNKFVKSLQTRNKFNDKILKNIKNISKYLNEYNVKIIKGSYDKILQNVIKDDFVYLDPPYPDFKKGNIGYQVHFNHLKFCKIFNKLKCKAIMSNLDCSIIRDNINGNIKNVEVILGHGFFKTKTEQFKRKEIIITNYNK